MDYEYLIRNPRAQFVRVASSRELLKTLVDFTIFDEKDIDGMPGDLEWLKMYNGLLSGYNDDYEDEDSDLSGLDISGVA